MSNNGQKDTAREQMISFITQALKHLDSGKLRNVYHFVRHIK